MSKSANQITEDSLKKILEIHCDDGASQGYTNTGYGVIDHCCAECGSFGEYGREWPCATATLAMTALNGYE